MNEPDEKDKVIFRFKDGLPRLRAKAQAMGIRSNHLARDLVNLGLDLGWADGVRTRPGPPPEDEYKALLVKACFAVIVALSPSMDEAETAAWLGEVFADTGDSK